MHYSYYLPVKQLQPLQNLKVRRINTRRQKNLEGQDFHWSALKLAVAES